jgi:hypothetical protein
MEAGSITFSETGYRISLVGGDGDPELFASPRALRLVEAAWFDGLIHGAKALLVLCEDGPYSGEFLALTARTQVDLNRYLMEERWASVVVHRLPAPLTSTPYSFGDTRPVGMAVIEFK